MLSLLSILILSYYFPFLTCKSFFVNQTSVNVSSNTTYCNQNQYLKAPFSILKYLDYLPSHYKFELELDINVFGTSKSNEIDVYFDSSLVASILDIPLLTNAMPVFYKTSFIQNSTLLNGSFDFGSQKMGLSQLNLSGCSNNNNPQGYYLKVLSEHSASTINITISFTSSASSIKWLIGNYVFKVWSKQIPSNCGNNCTSCESSNCDYCGGSLLNQEDVCVTNCSSNYSLLNGRCFQCYSTCLSCFDDDPNSCLTCYPNQFLSGNACVSTCPNGFYGIMGNMTCGICNSACLTCNGPNTDNCTSCNTSLLLINGSCVVNQSLSQNNSNATNSTISTTNSTMTNSTNSTNVVNSSNSNSSTTVNNTDSTNNVTSSNNNSILTDNTTNPINNSTVTTDNTTNLTETTSNSTSTTNSTNSTVDSGNTNSSNNVTITNNNTNITNSANNGTSNVFNSTSNITSVDNSTNSTINVTLADNTTGSTNNVSSTNNSTINNTNTTNDNSSVNLTSIDNSSMFQNCLNSSQFLNFSLNSCQDCNLSICKSCSYESSNCSGCFPGFYLDNNTCKFCDVSCSECQGPTSKDCTSCYREYFIQNNECLFPRNVSIVLTAINNPIDFILAFYSDGQLYGGGFFNNMMNEINFSISNFSKNKYEYSFSKIDQSLFNYSLKFNFTDNIYVNTSILQIKIENIGDSSVTLLNDSIDTLLNPLNLCSDLQTYYDNGNCTKKTLLDFTWMPTEKFNVISILFLNVENLNINIENFDSLLSEAINSNIFYVVKINDFKHDMPKYSFKMKENTTSAILEFNYSNKAFVKEDYNLIINQKILLQKVYFSKIMFKKYSLTFTIYDDYLGDSTAVKNSRTMTEIGDATANILIYLSYFLNSKSTFAVKGILLTHLLQLLKFVLIIYPSNAKCLFLNVTISNIFVKNAIFESNQAEMLLWGLPQRFLQYDVSLYLLNILADDYVLILILWAIGFFLLMNKFRFRCRKILDYMKSAFVWNVVIVISFSKYIYSVFFSLVALRFGFFLNSSNSFVSMIVLIFLVYLPFYYTYIIHRNTKKNIIIPAILTVKESPKNNNNLNTIHPLIDIKESRKFFEATKNDTNTVHTLLEIKESDSPKKSIFSSISGNTSAVLSPIKKNEDIFSPKKHKSQVQIESLKKEKINEIAIDSRKFNEIAEYRKSVLIESAINLDSKKAVLLETMAALPSSTNYLRPISEKKENNLNDSVFMHIAKNKNMERKNKISWFSVFVLKFKAIFRKIHDFFIKRENSEPRRKKYTVLTRDFKSYHSFHMIFDFLRFFIIPFIVVVLYGYPLVQMTLIFFTNFSYFMLLIFDLPFQSKMNNYFSVIYEICLNSGFISALILAFWDMQENYDVDARINLGWVLVFSYIVLLFFLVINSVLKLIKQFKGLIRWFFKKLK